MIFFRKVSFLLALAVLTSSCASILNARYQKVQVDTDPEAKILVNDEEPETKKGRVLVERNRLPKQITVSKEGYRDENYVIMQGKKSGLYALSVIPFGILLYPMVYDNGEKAFNYPSMVSIKNETKLVSEKLDDAKDIQLEKVSADIPADKMRYRYFSSYKEYIKEKDTKKTKPSSDDDGLKLENTIFSDMLNDILKEQGYIDTTRKVLKSSYLNNLKINATANRYTLHQVSSYHYTKYGGMMYVEIDVDWDVLDFYDETIHSLSTSTTSGQFAYFGDDDKSDAINESLRDALEIGLIQFMEDEKVQELLLDREEEKREKEFEPIAIITDNDYVSDLSEAIQSSVTIKTDEGHGSGFVISSDGYIITNYHVVTDTAGLKVIGNNNKEYYPTIERVSKIHDLALLKIESEEFKPFKIKLSKDIKIAEDIYAVGTPGGEDLSQTISRGIISGIRKKDSESKLIQTDASINSGNSGGAIVDQNGVVIGVVSSKLFGFGVEGVAFGIPSYELSDRLKLSFE